MQPQSPKPSSPERKPLSELSVGPAAMPVVSSLGGASMSIIDALHAALRPDIDDLVAFGRHERLTTAQYLARNAGTKQISLLQRMARVSKDDAGTSATRTALRGTSAPRFRLSSEVAADADAATSLVDLGKLNDIKTVFTFAGAGMGGGAGKGMDKAEFIAKAAAVLCPNFPEGVATWYDTVDCDGSGSVNWPKLAVVLQELEPSTAFVGMVAAGEPMASVSDAGRQQLVAGSGSPGVAVLQVPTGGSASAFTLGAPESPSGTSMLGGPPPRGNSPTEPAEMSVPTMSTNAPTAEAAAYEEEAVRKYCELPRMSLRPANTAVTMVEICYSRRVLFAGCEDGAVRIFDLREPTLPVRSVIHHADNAKLLAIDYSEARGHLAVATTSGSIFAYDTTSTVATRTGNIIRAFHVTPVSAAECRTPWFTKKTLPYDPHRMPNAHVLGFSKRLDNRLAIIDVPAAFLTFGGHLATGQHVLTALCQAPELAPPSAAIHADHLSPLIVGTAAGHVTCFRNICNGGLVPEDHAVAVTPAFSYRPHEASVSQVAFDMTNAVPCIYSASLDGTFACFDTRHEGLVWTFRLAPGPGAGRIGSPAATARPGSSAAARPGSAAAGAGVPPALGHSFDHPITGFSISRRLGLIATINRSRSVCVWSAHSANRVLTLSDHPVPVVDVAFNDTHGHLIAASEDSALRVWDVRTGKLLQVITRPSTHSMVGGRSASSGGWSRSIAALCVDRDSHALIAMTCCPLIYDEELRATKVSAAGASWPESYHGHFDPVEHVTYAADMGAVLTADSRRVSVWKAAGGHERISAFVPVEANASAASSYGATDHTTNRILGLTAMAGRECVLVWTASEVIVWRYRQPRAVRRFVGFAMGETMPDRVVPRAVLDLPPPHYLRQDGMNTAVVVTRTLVSIYFPATSASNSESAALHAVAVSPSAVVTPTSHTADHRHEGLLETAAPVLGGTAFVVISNCGDVFFVTLADATKEPHVLACVLACKMETDCRLYTFDESAANAITSSSVTASRIGRYRPRTGDLWKRALNVASTERRLGSAGFTRFKHETQQVLMSGTDFSVTLSKAHVLTFRGDGDALLWSFGEPTSRRRADGSWFCLHGSIPLTPELGACATGACFCSGTNTLFVADTSGYLSVYSVDLGEVAHPQSDMDGKSFRLLRSASGLDPRQFEGAVSPSKDVLVHAVGTRQYVIPVRAFALVGCFFMCRDVVNALAPLPPATTRPPDCRECPRVLVGTEGTQSLAYRLDRSSTPPRLLVEVALGDPRPALEPSWSGEHRFPWFMQKWEAGRGRSMRRDPGGVSPSRPSVKPPRAATVKSSSVSPTTFDAEFVCSPDHRPSSPEASICDLAHLQVESSVLMPPSALKDADALVQSLNAGADASSASPIVAPQQGPRLRAAGNRPPSRAVSRHNAEEEEASASSPPATPADRGPARSVDAFLRRPNTADAESPSPVSDSADPSDKLLRLVSRRPYLARATGFRAPTPGSPPRAQSAEPAGVSSAALEYLQKTLTASNNDDIARDAATSYRSLQLPGIPGDVERRLAEASASAVDKDRALGGGGGPNGPPRSRRGGPPRPLVDLVEPAHRRRPATGGRLSSTRR